MKQGDLLYCQNEYQEPSHNREENGKVKEYSRGLWTLKK